MYNLLKYLKGSSYYELNWRQVQKVGVNIGL